MLSKMMILLIALGIVLPIGIEKGVESSLEDPTGIEEYKEYEEYTKEVIAKAEEEAEMKAKMAKAAKEIATLEELEAKLEGMDALEIYSYLIDHSIQFSMDEVTGYPYKQYCIVIPEGDHLIHIHWYDDIEDIYMSVEAFGDSTCPNSYR